MNQYDLQPRHPYWRTFATILWSVAIFGVFVMAQMFGIMTYLTRKLGRPLTESDIMNILPTLESDGNGLIWATLASFVVTVPLIFLIIKFKRGSRIADYLAFNNTRAMNYVKWLVIMIVTVMILGWIGVALGEKSATDFTANVLNSADNKFLLYVAVAFCAPVFEELMFRGFMYKGLSEGPLQPVGAIIVTSALWASIHFQYSWYPVLMIFVMGLVLGWSRWKTQSIYVPILLHAANNFMSLYAFEKGWS